MERSAIFFVGLMLLTFSSCNDKESDSSLTVQATPGTSITLTPNASTYDLIKVPRGVVEFLATIKNESPETITIAHPSKCRPANHKIRAMRHFTDNHGKSEILLAITKPNGVEVILRDGWMHGFDPSATFLLTIPPGKTESFSLGWFFQNARGRWENDREAWTVFLDRGTYKAKIILRNALPRASVYNTVANRQESVSVWMGEMQSEEVSVEIK